jgi:hypothetical protein
MLPRQRDFFTPYMEGQPYVVAGRTLLLSRQGTQQRDPLGMLIYSLAVQPLILSFQSKCELELNLWYADDGNLVGSIAEIAKAYRILKDDGPTYPFALVTHKTNLSGGGQWTVRGCGSCLTAAWTSMTTPAPGYRPCGLASRLRPLCEAAPHCEEHQGGRVLGNDCRHGQCADCDAAT